MVKKYKEQFKLTSTPRHAHLSDKDAASIRVELKSQTEPCGTVGKQPGSFTAVGGWAASATPDSSPLRPGR